MGNRLSEIEGQQGTLYTYNAANMLLTRGADPYLNDLNGNTLSGGGRVNTWDSQNRLVQCVSGGHTSQYVSGADGLRRTSIVNGNATHYALDNGMLVREFSATLTPKATYLIGPRGPEYRRDDQTQAIRWYLYDGLGSVLGEVDTAGNLTASRKYDVYGLVRAGDIGTSRHKFVGSLGHTSEDETGLIYMRARWMDPSLGRFISEDPARDGANWFGYCRGNPVNAVDPDGRETLASTVSANGARASIQGIGGMSAARFMIWLSRTYGVNLRSVQWAQRGQYVTAGSKLWTLLERLEQDPRAWRMLVAEVEGPGSGFLKAWVQYTGRQIVAYLLASPDELEYLTHAVPHISK